MWQKHPVELCARVQTVYDLRNAATGDTLCNYDGALICIAAYHIFYCKAKLIGKSTVNSLLGILRYYKDVFHGADVQMMMGKS